MRAAKWIRESSKAQEERYGPEAQRALIDRAIADAGATDTGIEWCVTHSGGSIDTTPEWAEMLARAGLDYDRLYVGYASRFARNTVATLSAIEKLHAAGADLYFSDRRLCTSDPLAWDQYARDAVENESYLRQLSRRTSEGYAAKYSVHSDQGGNAPLGFRRSGPNSLLEIDPESIAVAVGIFERYALGNVSQERLAAETGLEAERIKEILRNPIYNGYVGRYDDRTEAAWRSDPPVNDDLWERVVQARASRSRGGGPRDVGRVDLLAGLLYCASCGTRIRSDGRDGVGQLRKRHVNPCDAWGARERCQSWRYEQPILGRSHNSTCRALANGG